MHIDKSVWKDFLIFVEQERGDIHPVAYELIGQARKLAAKVDFKVHCVLIGGAGTKENAKKLLAYGIDTAYVYEDEAFEDFLSIPLSEVHAICYRSPHNPLKKSIFFKS